MGLLCSSPIKLRRPEIDRVWVPSAPSRSRIPVGVVVLTRTAA